MRLVKVDKKYLARGKMDDWEDGKEYEIGKCYETCPYFSTPNHIMSCFHPETQRVAKETKNPWYEAFIERPDCENGFPKLCPLI